MTWISYRNYLTQATLVSSRDLPALPVSKVQIPVVKERYRVAELSAGDTRTKVDISFGGLNSENTFVEIPRRATVVAWIRPAKRLAEEEVEAPSFLATDLVRHTISTDDQFTADEYDPGVDSTSDIVLGRGVHCALLPDGTPTPYASFAFDALSRTQPPANFVDWGYAWYGRKDFEPKIDYAGPAIFGYAENAVRRFSEDNSALYVRRKRQRRRWQLRFNALSWETERAAYDDFLRYVGDGGRFLLGLDDDDLGENVVLAMLDPASTNLARVARRFFQGSLPIVEAT